YRLGSEATFDKDVAAFADCKEAADAVQRMTEHLKSNGVDLASAVGRIGPKLAIDVKTETFMGSGASRANSMLFREYRKGFEVTESV
ncbi:MAG TPA: gfo/Idh/MocA family oxidoreductase, partial [Urbifossiella sp.]